MHSGFCAHNSDSIHVTQHRDQRWSKPRLHKHDSNNRMSLCWTLLENKNSAGKSPCANTSAMIFPVGLLTGWCVARASLVVTRVIHQLSSLSEFTQRLPFSTSPVGGCTRAAAKATFLHKAPSQGRHLAERARKARSGNEDLLWRSGFWAALHTLWALNLPDSEGP